MVPQIWHIIPNGDEQEHVAIGESCSCVPRLELQPSRAMLIIHHAWDNREFDEIAEGLYSAE